MNVAGHVGRVAREAPDRPAIVFEGRPVSYAALDAGAGLLARALERKGVRRGDRVALYLPNIPAFALCYLAAQRLGAVAVSVSSAFKSEEVKFILNDSGARAVFTTAELLAHVPKRECPALEHAVNCEGAADAEPLGEWLEAGAGDPLPAADMRADEPAALLYSSGTTGFPKGVTLTPANVISNTRSAARYSGYRSEDRLACFLPLFHVYAQNYIMNAAFEAGATVVLFRRFVPEQVLEAIGRERITMFFGVPAIFIALLGMDRSKYDLSSLRYEMSAAATMPQEVSRRWTEAFGRRVYEGYGLTECSPFACYNHATDHRHGSVGTAIEGFELRIFDEADREVPRGEWGEIVIRGPGVMQGYWNRPQDTAQALRSGWLHSGDIGRMVEIRSSTFPAASIVAPPR